MPASGAGGRRGSRPPYCSFLVCDAAIALRSCSHSLERRARAALSGERRGLRGAHDEFDLPLGTCRPVVAIEARSRTASVCWSCGDRADGRSRALVGPAGRCSPSGKRERRAWPADRREAVVRAAERAPLLGARTRANSALAVDPDPGLTIPCGGRALDRARCATLVRSRSTSRTRLSSRTRGTPSAFWSPSG